MQIGDILKNKRLKKGYSQKKLSEISGVSLSAIQKCENGIRNPKIETLNKIAAALDVPLDVPLNVPLNEIIKDNEMKDEAIFDLVKKLNNGDSDDIVPAAIKAIRLIHLPPEEYKKELKLYEQELSISNPFKYLIINEDIEKEFNYSASNFTVNEIKEIEDFLREMLEFKINQIKNKGNKHK